MSATPVKENREGYELLVAKIKSLEKELANSALECAASNAVEKEINAHFAKCVKLLTARRETLLKQVPEVLKDQKKMSEAYLKKLTASIVACKEILAAGEKTFEVSPTTADTVWRGQASITSDPHESKICVELPPDMFDFIQFHGKVKEKSSGRIEYPRAVRVETFAGQSVSNKGPAIKLDKPLGACFNPRNKCLYVADCNNDSIKKITLQGEVSEFAKVEKPTAVAMFHKDQILYVVSSSTDLISKITSSGVVVTIFAGAFCGYADGDGTDARFKSPTDVAVDQQTGCVYVCDAGNHRIRKITPYGKVSTFAGSSRKGYKDGTGKASQFNCPLGICFDDNARRLLVADHENNKLRQILINGEVSTLCSVPAPTTVATINHTFLIASEFNMIFTVTPHGHAVVLAGTGDADDVDGIPLQSCFNSPVGLVVHDKACYVVDEGNDAIKKIVLSNVN